MSGCLPIRFGVFELEPRARELRKQGIRVKLQDQPLQVLEALLEHPGELVTREELQRRIWGNDTFVDFDHGLNAAVKRLRDALGDSADNPRYVETMARRGYRFIAPVERVPLPQHEPVHTPALTAPARRPYARFAWLAAGLLAATGALLWLVVEQRPAAPPHLVPLTTYSGVETFPAFSPDGNQVAFSWNGENHDNADIYVKVVGDTNALRITTDAARDYSPAWSPDGRQIAFGSDRRGGGTYLVSALGGAEQRLANLAPNGAPVWSQDGKYLLVAWQPAQPVAEPGSGDLVAIPVEGGGMPIPILASPPGTWARDPTVAPGGRALAFASCTGTASLLPSCGLLVADLKDGMALASEPRTVTKPVGPIRGIAWTPDGSSLVYGSHTGAEQPFGLALWRVNVKDGKEPQRVELAGVANWPAVHSASGRLAFSRVTSTDLDIWRLESGGMTNRFLPSSHNEFNPQYSPDGRQIAFASDRGNETAVWTANADGTGPVQITRRKGGYGGTPRWSPDGRWLAFDSWEGGKRWEIWVVEAGGGARRQLTDGPTDNFAPSWSRDGKFVYFASTRDGKPQVWRVPVQGGPTQQVTRNGGFIAFESPDRKALYYTVSNSGDEGLYTKQLPEGAERQVVKDGIARRGFAVFPDGVYYLHGLPKNAFEIRFHEFATGRARVIGATEGPLGLGFAVSPDRKHFLFSKSRGEPESDLMLIENFR